MLVSGGGAGFAHPLQFRQQLLDHPFGLGTVTAAEQAEMIEHVVQVIERPPLRIASGQWPSFPVGGVKAVRKPAEQLSYRQIGLAVAVIDRRIEHHRRAISRAARRCRPKDLHRPGAAAAQRQILQHQIGAPGDDAMAQRGEHPHGRGCRQCCQPGCLGLEQRQASSVVNLDEIRPVPVTHPPGLIILLHKTYDVIYERNRPAYYP